MGKPENCKKVKSKITKKGNFIFRGIQIYNNYDSYEMFLLRRIFKENGLDTIIMYYWGPKQT